MNKIVEALMKDENIKQEIIQYLRNEEMRPYFCDDESGSSSLDLDNEHRLQFEITSERTYSLELLFEKMEEKFGPHLFPLPVSTIYGGAVLMNTDGFKPKEIGRVFQVFQDVFEKCRIFPVTFLDSTCLETTDESDYVLIVNSNVDDQDVEKIRIPLKGNPILGCGASGLEDAANAAASLLKDMEPFHLVIGYKVTKPDYTCKGFKYQIGEQYHADMAKLHHSGYHFAVDKYALFNWYQKFDPANKVLLVQAGPVVESDGRVAVTDNLLVLEELDWKDLL